MSSSSETLGTRAGSSQGGAVAMKALIVVHRYLGVALGLLMTLWCLSGFVMLYASYPNLTQAERVKGLEPLRLAGCCDLSRLQIDPDAAIGDMRLEMLLGRPVLRVSVDGEPRALDLADGKPVGRLTPQQVLDVARAHGRQVGIAGAPGQPKLIEMDQWSISTDARSKPLYRIRFDDPKASDLYVSGASGLVVLDTTRTERILGWLGPVPHWLYPRLLKQNNKLWTQVVIWTSTLGVFLTVLGLWIGIVRFKRRANGRWSPYRGLLWQHHVPGLIFGLLTLTWVFSGLMTMGPWGTLRGHSGQLRRAFIGQATWAQASGFLARAPALAGAGVVQYEAAPLGGRFFALANRHDGSLRLDGEGRPAPVTQTDLLAAAKAMDAPARALVLMTAEDGYYYGRGKTADLPVWRLILGDPGATRLYIHPKTARVLRAAGPEDRARRWIETSLHDLDFAWIRKKPVWDLVIIPLLAGVTFLCATGVWLGLRRIGRDLAALRSAVARRRTDAQP